MELEAAVETKRPFVSALLFLHNMLKEIPEDCDSKDSILDSRTSFLGTEMTSLTLDALHFGIFLQQLERLKNQATLLTTIKHRRAELLKQKEHFRPMIENLKRGADLEFYMRVEELLQRGRLIPNPHGTGSSYFLIDEEATAQFVIKPVDEDVFCLNNPKEFGSPFNDSEHRVRDQIPLYRSAQTDAFCWQLACLADLENATPKTLMGIVKSDTFYDVSLWIDLDSQEQFFLETGTADKEKLCSIQEFIPDSQDLIELLHELYAKALSNEEIAASFDQDDFEQVCLFVWLLYDNDAHGKNFRSYCKGEDLFGKKIYGIKKIDNSLSLPEKNTQYSSILAWMPNAMKPISDQLKWKIAHLPVEKILKQMDEDELDNCKDSFKERVEILKTLSQREGITSGEIDLRLSFLSRKQGKEIVLSFLTKEQILKLLIGSSHSPVAQGS